MPVPIQNSRRVFIRGLINDGPGFLCSITAQLYRNPTGLLRRAATPTKARNNGADSWDVWPPDEPSRKSCRTLLPGI